MHGHRGELGDAGKPLLAMAYGYLAWGRKGHEFSIARRQMEESLRIAREAGEPWALAHSLIGMGVISGIAGEYDAARGYYEESMHCFECAGDRLLSMVPRKNLGLALYRQGQLAAARICLEESAEVFQVIGGSVNLSEAQNALGAIAALDGQYIQARQFHLDALAFGRRSGDTEGIAEALICLGDVDRRENDYQSAGERYMESLQNPHTVGQKHLLSRAVESAAMLATVRGQAAVAASLFGAAEYMRQAGGYQLHPIEQPDHDRHISVLRQHLPEEALAQAWSLGQSWTLDSVIAAVRQLAAPEPHRAAPLRSPVPAALAAAGLTVREVAVLQQLAQGLSNPEIARQLNISPRTVDAHLRSIFSKLDVTSRTAAVRAASDLNIS